MGRLQVLILGLVSLWAVASSFLRLQGLPGRLLAAWRVFLWGLRGWSRHEAAQRGQRYPVQALRLFMSYGMIAIYTCVNSVFLLHENTAIQILTYSIFFSVLFKCLLSLKLHFTRGYASAKTCHRLIFCSFS